jgi:hypothetical protein
MFHIVHRGQETGRRFFAALQGLREALGECLIRCDEPLSLLGRIAAGNTMPRIICACRN